MAVKNVTLTKRDYNIPIYQLIKGDRKTSGIALNINRYDGSHDLSTLGWCINVVNANGDSDIIMFTPTVGEMWLVYEFEFPAIVSAEVGETVFNVEAVNTVGDKVWQSGKRVITVTDGIEAEAGYDPDELSIFQQTVSTVGTKVSAMGTKIDGYETRITTAETAANTAATNATNAANSANQAAQNCASVVTTAQQAAASATQAVTSANTAVANAQTAIATANSASTAAQTAATNAQQVATSIAQQAESGAFNGKDGKDGDDGYTPVKGVDYTDGVDGNDWIPTDAELEGIATNAANKLQPTITTLTQSVDSATSEVGKKIDKPLQNPTAVGKVLKVQSVNADGSFVCVWDDEQSLPDVPVKGVKVAGKALTPDSDGNVNIPYAVEDGTGVVRVSGNYGLQTSGGFLTGVTRNLTGYTNAWGSHVVNKGTLENIKEDYVKRALTSDSLSLDDVAKKACCATLGAKIDDRFALFGTYTFEEDVASFEITNLNADNVYVLFRGSNMPQSGGEFDFNFNEEINPLDRDSVNSIPLVGVNWNCAYGFIRCFNLNGAFEVIGACSNYNTNVNLQMRNRQSYGFSRSTTYINSVKLCSTVKAGLTIYVYTTPHRG